MDWKKELDGWGDRLPDVQFISGAAQSDGQIAELEAELGCRFPDDYRSFLRSFGGLRVEADTRWMYGRTCVRGVGVEDGELLDGPAELAADCEDWSRDPLEGYVPFFGYWDRGVEDGYAFDSDGGVHSIYRGTVESTAISFAELLADNLTLLEGALQDAEQKNTRRDTVLSELAARYGDAAEMRNGQLFVRRADGVEVNVKLGDGREFRHGSGLFYLWREPADGWTIPDICARNAQMLAGRGGLDGDEVRFRGRILLNEMDSSTLAHILHVDAGLGDPAPFVLSTSREEVDDWVFERENRSFLREHNNPVRVDDDTWTFSIGRSSSGQVLVTATFVESPPSVCLRAEVGTPEIARDEALEIINGMNRGLPLIKSDMDINGTMENMRHLSLENGTLVVRDRLLPNMLDQRGAQTTLGDIGTAAGHARKDLVIREPLPIEEIEAALQMKAGPLTIALCEAELEGRRTSSLQFGSNLKSLVFFDRYRPHKRERFASTWGDVRPFMEVHDVGELRIAQWTAAIVLGGATSDDCPIVLCQPWGDEGDAVWVASNLEDFLSLLAIGSAGGAIFDETDAEFALRRYRELAASYRAVEFQEVMTAIGIEPTDDPLSIVSSGEPRRGRVEVSKNLEEA